MPRELNLSGSFANVVLRRAFNLGGLSDVEADNKLALTVPLDPERCEPYGPWKRAAAGFADDTVLAQPYSAGIINPANSGSICVVEFAAIACGTTCKAQFAVISAPAALHATTAAFVQIDGSDTTTPGCPIYYFRDTNLGAAGQLIGGDVISANRQMFQQLEGLPIYPGSQLAISITPGTPSGVGFAFRIRFTSPVPR